MAIKRTAYSCDFKCGKKVVLSKKSMEDHETRCFHNPEKKACASCKFFDKFSDGNGLEGTSMNEEWVALLCNAPEIGEEIDSMTFNCEFHEPK